MNKNEFNEFLGSLDSEGFILRIYWNTVISLLIFPVILWILIRLEWLLLS